MPQALEEATPSLAHRVHPSIHNDPVVHSKLLMQHFSMIQSQRKRQQVSAISDYNIQKESLGVAS